MVSIPVQNLVGKLRVKMAPVYYTVFFAHSLWPPNSLYSLVLLESCWLRKGSTIFSVCKGGTGIVLSVVMSTSVLEMFATVEPVVHPVHHRVQVQ